MEEGSPGGFCPGEWGTELPGTTAGNGKWAGRLGDVGWDSFSPGSRSSGSGGDRDTKAPRHKLPLFLVVTSQTNLSGSLFLFFPVASEEHRVLMYSFSEHGVFKELQIMQSD